MRMMRVGALIAAAVVVLTGCATPQSVAGGLDNASAALAIKSRMLRSDESFSGVDVKVVDGVALLIGHVPSDAAKGEAGAIAWNAPNIRDVGNELVVDPDGRRLLGANDQLINSQVRARLVADRQVRATSVHVEVYDGVVYLLGRARTASEVARIAESAAGVAGVDRVVSFLSPDVPAIGQPSSVAPYQPSAGFAGEAQRRDDALLGGPDG